MNERILLEQILSLQYLIVEMLTCMAGKDDSKIVALTADVQARTAKLKAAVDAAQPK